MEQQCRKDKINFRLHWGAAGGERPRAIMMWRKGIRHKRKWKCRERVKEQEMSREKWQISERRWAWRTGKRFLAFVHLHSSPSQMRKTMTKMNGLEEDQCWETKDDMSRIEINRNSEARPINDETRSRKSLWSQNFQLTYVWMRWTISNERIKRTLTDLAVGGHDKEDFLITSHQSELGNVQTWTTLCAKCCRMVILISRMFVHELEEHRLSLWITTGCWGASQTAISMFRRIPTIACFLCGA